MIIIRQKTTSTPGGAFEIAYLLGRDETLARVQKAIEKLRANA